MASRLQSGLNAVFGGDKLKDALGNAIKFNPLTGPAYWQTKWLLEDPSQAQHDAAVQQSREIVNSPQYQQFRNNYDARAQAARQLQKSQRQDQLERMASINDRVNSDAWLQRKAASQINPIYRPQIRGVKQNIRQTMKQGRRAASDVEGFYDSAAGKVSNLAKASNRNTKTSIQNIRQGQVRGGARNISRSEGQMGAKAIRGLGKAGNSFMKQLQGSIAAEGGMAAADTMNSYRQLANDERQKLSDLRTQRAAAMQQAQSEISKKIKQAGKKIYNNNFLGNIAAGNSVADAQQAAIAVAQQNNPAVRSAVAKSILAARGNEQGLADAYQNKVESNPDYRDQQREDLQTALDIIKLAGDQGRTNISDRAWQLLAAQGFLG